MHDKIAGNIEFELSKIREALEIIAEILARKE